MVARMSEPWPTATAAENGREKRVTERKQDTWRVIINADDENGKRIYGLRVEGVIDLPRPMTAIDAADYALRVAVRQGPLPSGIEAAVWGRADIGSEIMHLCTAVAKYDDGQSVYLRYTPWLGDGEYREIGEPEGAAIFPIGREIA